MRIRRAIVLGAATLLVATMFSLGHSAAQNAGRPTSRPAAKPADAAGAADDRRADREAIAASAREFVAAFDARDAAKIAAQFTSAGELHTDAGETLSGRAAIQKSYREYFAAAPKCAARVEILGVRFLSDDLAVEEGVFWATPEGPALPTSTRYSALHVRESGRWSIAFCREWGGSVAKLSDLDWLVGDWKADGPDHSVEMRFEWNPSRTVLLNRFTRREGEKVVARGEQWIKVDPRTGRLQSWSTDEDGGRGEAVWYRDGDAWVSAASGVLPSGVATEARNLISRAGADEIVWRSVRRAVNGRPTPDTAPVKLQRVKAAR